MYPSHSRSHLVTCCLDENVNEALVSCMRNISDTRVVGTKAETNCICICDNKKYFKNHNIIDSIIPSDSLSVKIRKLKELKNFKNYTSIDK